MISLYLFVSPNSHFCMFGAQGKQCSLVATVPSLCFSADRNKLFLKQRTINEVRCELLVNKTLTHSF